MNYVDDEYIVDILGKIARETKTHEVKINFSTGETEPVSAAENQTISKSIKYWQEWLPELLKSQMVDPMAVNAVVVRYRMTKVGPEVIVEAQDDRGKEHKVFVATTL